MNKGIIILGSPASGKTTFIENLWSNISLKEFYILNQDIFVEDKLHSCYNNPLMAANWIYNIELPKITQTNTNFLLDTTGSNLKTLRKIIDIPNYQFKAVVVYCNPIIAFIRNFSRERKLPKQVLLENWLKVYSQTDEYIKMFGEDNIYIYETEYTEEEKQILNKKEGYYTSAYKELKCLNVESSFKKETTVYTIEQIKEKQYKFESLLYKIDNSIQNIEMKFLDYDRPKEYIKEELNKWIKI